MAVIAPLSFQLYSARLASPETAVLKTLAEAGYTNGQTISLLELSGKSGDFQSLINHYRQHHDLLGFTVSLISTGSDA